MSKQHVWFVVRALVAAVVVVLGIRMFFLSDPDRRDDTTGLTDGTGLGTGDGTGSGLGADGLPVAAAFDSARVAERARDRRDGIESFADFAGADGQISVAEFGAFVAAFCPNGEECPDVEFQTEVVEYYDANGDGGLDAAEWERLHTEATGGEGPLGSE